MQGLLLTMSAFGGKADIVTYVSSTIYAVVVAPWGNTNVPHILSN
jgi:hypothetical protein